MPILRVEFVFDVYDPPEAASNMFTERIRRHTVCVQVPISEMPNALRAIRIMDAEGVPIVVIPFGDSP
jgi:hypothetical protein